MRQEKADLETAGMLREGEDWSERVFPSLLVLGKRSIVRRDGGANDSHNQIELSTQSRSSRGFAHSRHELYSAAHKQAEVVE